MDDSTRDERLNMVLEHLHLVSEGLAIEVSKEFHGVRDIIISADGDKNKSLIVKEIVSEAPKIPGWTVTAFRQKAKDEFLLRYRHLEFDPAKMFFHSVVSHDSLDIIVYSDSIKYKNQDEVIKYGLITMDNVLGECVATLKVRTFDFRDISDAENKDELQKMNKLPEFVDSFYAKNHSK
ncbi:hypothetical protein A8B98_14290 [Hymenobacter sp. UV11]|nr:hypothetical protein A8B98_14290 [Hymenobacter sp. UV11]